MQVSPVKAVFMRGICIVFIALTVSLAIHRDMHALVNCTFLPKMLQM